MEPLEKAFETTRWLAPDEEEMWISLTGVLLKLPFALDSCLRQRSGVSFFEYLILSVLSESREHTMPMGDLATLANSSPSRTSHAVSRLEGKGWIRRQQDPSNGRFMLAQLTDEGLVFLRAAAPDHVATVRALVFDALDTDQVEQLDAITKSILGRITTQDNWPPRGTRAPLSDADGTARERPKA